MESLFSCQPWSICLMLSALPFETLIDPSIPGLKTTLLINHEQLLCCDESCLGHLIDWFILFVLSSHGCFTFPGRVLSLLTAGWLEHSGKSGGQPMGKVCVDVWSWWRWPQVVVVPVPFLGWSVKSSTRRLVGVLAMYNFMWKGSSPVAQSHSEWRFLAQNFRTPKVKRG